MARPHPQLAVALVVLGLSRFLSAQEVVELTSADGSQTIEAAVVRLDRHGVDLAFEDGRSLEDVSLDFFDEMTVRLLREIAVDLPLEMPLRGANRHIQSDRLNEVFGIPLFRNCSLWDEDPAAVALRLGWPEEGSTSFSASYRGYFTGGEEILGAVSWTGAILAEEGGIVRLSLVFANRGDSFGAAGEAEQHFEGGTISQATINAFLEEFDAEYERIRATLTGVLGEPEQQRYGDGAARTLVDRWDWIDMSLLLVRHEGAMLQLLVVPEDLADDTGKVGRVQDAEIEERIAGGVTRRPHGDVIIDQIPMVDQGPKGYCVPATMERVMRYMGVPADMYEIAVLSQSGYGGGTGMGELIEGLHHDIRWGGRKLEGSESGELDMEEIAEKIDEGIPLIWGLASTPEYNALSDELTERRSACRDAADWAAYVDSINDLPEGEAHIPLPEPGWNHIVLIIGYNADSGEIATSDSWGPEFVERWVPLVDARRVSMDALFWIEP